MNRFMFVPAIALLLSAAASAEPAPAGYDLRGPAPKKGMVVRDTMKFTMNDADINIGIGCLSLSGKLDMTATTEQEEEVLGVDGRDVVKLRTKVLKDEMARKTVINGMTMESTEKKNLVGEFVYSEKTKDGWKHSLEDAKPTEKQQKELKNFDEPINDDELYPEGKVRVGQTWDIKPGAFKKIIGAKMTDAKGSAKGKFVRVEKFNGEECVIEIEFDVTARLKDDDSDLAVTMKGKMTNDRSIAEGIDLKFFFEGTAKFDGDTDEDGTKAKIMFSGKMKGEGTTQIKKK